jgi:hypothetical protein
MACRVWGAVFYAMWAGTKSELLYGLHGCFLNIGAAAAVAGGPDEAESCRSYSLQEVINVDLAVSVSVHHSAVCEDLPPGDSLFGPFLFDQVAEHFLDGPAVLNIL